jgi:hypothetical protein
VSFAVSFTPAMRVLLGALGTGPSRSRVAAHGDAVEAVMGWAFRAVVPARRSSP